MRKCLLMVVLNLVLLGTSGCIIVHTEEDVSCKSAIEREAVTACHGDPAALPGPTVDPPSQRIGPGKRG